MNVISHTISREHGVCTVCFMNIILVISLPQANWYYICRRCELSDQYNLNGFAFPSLIYFKQQAYYVCTGDGEDRIEKGKTPPSDRQLPKVIIIKTWLLLLLLLLSLLALFHSHFHFHSHSDDSLSYKHPSSTSINTVNKQREGNYRCGQIFVVYIYIYLGMYLILNT